MVGEWVNDWELSRGRSGQGKRRRWGNGPGTWYGVGARGCRAGQAAVRLETSPRRLTLCPLPQAAGGAAGDHEAPRDGERPLPVSALRGGAGPPRQLLRVLPRLQEGKALLLCGFASWLAGECDVFVHTCMRASLVLSSKEPACPCGRRRFNPWVRKIPWRRRWPPTPVFFPGKFQGAWRTTVHGVAESQTWLSD